MIRPCCGSRGKRHRNGCLVHGDGSRAQQLADCLVWFTNFGNDDTCISPNGRERFAWLLGEVERLSLNARKRAK